MVDTNCDPTEVDYVIPGNDDALRAIRLFASKIADSVVEGVQASTDKQSAEFAGITAAADTMRKRVESAGEDATGAAAAEGDDNVDLEAVLGKGVRKVEAEPAEEASAESTA